MKDFEITHYQKGDFTEIAALWSQLELGGAERGDDELVIERTLQNGAAFFVMRYQHNIIGTAWITNDHRRLYLHHMGIAEKFQNRGLGRYLLKHCLKWSKQQNLQLKLEVHIENKNATYLYEKSGFKRLGDYDVYIIRNYDELPENY